MCVCDPDRFHTSAQSIYFKVNPGQMKPNVSEVNAQREEQQHVCLLVVSS